MHVTRVRFWILAVLLFVYLAGVLILSAVTLHEPKTIALTSDKQFQQSLHQTNRLKSLEYGIPGLRPPLRRTKIQWCSNLSYSQVPNPPNVALVSFPGSGNTWLRYLLQQATGIYTGSVYKDYGLLKNGFPAESIVNGSVLLVKTHEWGPNARQVFHKAVLLVRAPQAAIQAEFNRQSGGHIGFASPDRYRRTKGKYWQQFVHDKLEAWKMTNLDWLFNFTGPTHVIFYEQLVDNLENTLRSVIGFLDENKSQSGLFKAERFRCAIERKEGIYRRKRRALNFDPYSSLMKQQLHQVQKQVYDAIYNFATPG